MEARSADSAFLWHLRHIQDKMTPVNDKLWRLDNLYFIKTKDMRQVPVRLNWAQRDFITKRSPKSFILKARQLGFTTACLIDMLDGTIRYPE